MRKFLTAVCALAVATALAACGDARPVTTAPRCDGRIDGHRTLSAWFHAGAGREPETMREFVSEFNRSQSQVTVQLQLLPENKYNDLVQAGAAAGSLPQLLDFDGPYLPSLAYSDALFPLDSCIPAELKADLLPSIVQMGTFRGQLFSLGAMGDCGLGLFARRSVLQRVGMRLPAGPADAWTATEFTDLLWRLRAAGYQHPLDLKVDYRYGTEFFTYAFSPVVQSVGADLVDRRTWRAGGTLNSPAAVQALKVVQGWSAAGYVDPGTDDLAFISGRSPISWVGHWEFGRYSSAVGSDLVIVPLPRFGARTVTAMGSWHWGLTTATEDMDAGWAFLQFLMQPRNQLRWSALAYNLPATKTAVAVSPQFKPGGPERLYYDQIMGGYTVPRPQTPGYPVISAAFSDAFGEIMGGAAVQATLDQAARTIDADMISHDNYATPAK
jgi:multiple sugar transport system substrate-binding protein